MKIDRSKDSISALREGLESIKARNSLKDGEVAIINDAIQRLDSKSLSASDIVDLTTLILRFLISGNNNGLF